MSDAVLAYNSAVVALTLLAADDALGRAHGATLNLGDYDSSLARSIRQAQEGVRKARSVTISWTEPALPDEQPQQPQRPSETSPPPPRTGDTTWEHPHLPNEGKSSEWYTPPAVFDALGLRFDLDPCAPPGGVPWVPADRHYSDDGLNRPWHGRVWLNPPYGKEAGAWVNRLADHGDGIALVFSRTDVRWWHSAASRATVICLVRGRLTFIPGAGQSAPGNSGGPSALLAFGDECARAVSESGLGMTLRPSSPSRTTGGQDA